MPTPENDYQINPTLLRLLSRFGLASHPKGVERLTSDDDDAGDSPADLIDAITRQQSLAKWWESSFTLADGYADRCKVYEEMDRFDLVRSMLDLITEEATQPDPDRRATAWVSSKNTELVNRSQDFFRNAQVEDTLPGITRAMCKYGNRFQRIAYGGGLGVLAWGATAPGIVQRVDDAYGRLIGFTHQNKDTTFRGGLKYNVSWPWDFVHFRLIGADDTTGNGTSLLDSVFRPWRQLVMAEDSTLLLQLRRAGDRNVVFVDVGDMEEHDAMSWVNVWRKKFRKSEYLDPASANYRKNYNPFTTLEDIFVPIREGENSRVESLSGNTQIGDSTALDYFTNKFFGAARVPKAYMGFEGDINAKATLSQQDIRFARTCKRVQRSVIQGLRRSLDIHFALLTKSDGSPVFDLSGKDGEYLVEMAPVSNLDEANAVEIIRLRNEITTQMADLASNLNLDARVWATYLLLNYAKLPEDTVLKLIAKTDVTPTGGGDPAAGTKAESVDSTKGFYNFSPQEAMECAKLVHRSPVIRRLIGSLAEEGDTRYVESQSDTSILPVTSGSTALTEHLLRNNTDEAKRLHEHMEKLKQSPASSTLVD